MHWFVTSDCVKHSVVNRPDCKIFWSGTVIGAVSDVAVNLKRALCIIIIWHPLAFSYKPTSFSFCCGNSFSGCYFLFRVLLSDGLGNWNFKVLVCVFRIPALKWLNTDLHCLCNLPTTTLVPRFHFFFSLVSVILYYFFRNYFVLPVRFSAGILIPDFTSHFVK